MQQDLQGLYVVKVRGSTTALADAMKRAGVTVRSVVPQIGMVTIAGLDDNRAAALAKRSDVAGVYRDVMVSTGLPKRVGAPLQAGARIQGPDQSGAFFFGVQWNLPITSADQAWGQTSSGAGRTVWVLDTGYDPYHQDLRGHTPCYTTGITVPRFTSDLYALDFNFHGSFV
ncbi:MAG: hypothetical protein ABI877_09495, partial [Gemmatimonadaceae bacterium]